MHTLTRREEGLHGHPTVAKIIFGIARVAEPGFHAEPESWLRDGVRPWFGGRVLEVDEAVLPAWRPLVVEGQKARYTYAQPLASQRQRACLASPSSRATFRILSRPG